MSEHIVSKGGYYEFGKQLGELTKDDVNRVLHSFKESSLYKDLVHYLETSSGKEDLERLKVTAQTHVPDVVTELRGLADGSGCHFDDLILLNLVNEFAAILTSLPGNSHGVNYSTTCNGCTNISTEDKYGHMYLAHTEDINPDWTGYGIMLTATIHAEEQTDVLEEWTQLVIPGVLPGSTFGFNRFGLLNAHNNIYQNDVNKEGIPRLFMCRTFLNCKNVAEIKLELSKQPGIASGISLQYLQMNESENKEVTINNDVIEVAGCTMGTLTAGFKPRGFYHHCNIYQHLRHECHPEESSIHRAAAISQYVNRGQTNTLEYLKTIISDISDKRFPIYRTGTSPDYLVTAATGLYDVADRKLHVFKENPAISGPTYVFSIPCIASD